MYALSHQFKINTYDLTIQLKIRYNHIIIFERLSMSDKGILYLMTTCIDGLVKIGKTGSNNFEDRMYILENNGYRNINQMVGYNGKIITIIQ